MYQRPGELRRVFPFITPALSFFCRCLLSLSCFLACSINLPSGCTSFAFFSFSFCSAVIYQLGMLFLCAIDVAMLWYMCLVLQKSFGYGYASVEAKDGGQNAVVHGCRHHPKRHCKGIRVIAPALVIRQQRRPSPRSSRLKCCYNRRVVRCHHAMMLEPFRLQMYAGLLMRANKSDELSSDQEVQPKTGSQERHTGNGLCFL